MQDEITEAVTIAIAPAIATAERQRAMRMPPASLDAWAAYQRGLWHDPTRTNPRNRCLSTAELNVRIQLPPAPCRGQRWRTGGRDHRRQPPTIAPTGAAESDTTCRTFVSGPAEESAGASSDCISCASRLKASRNACMKIARSHIGARTSAASRSVRATVEVRNRSR